MAEDPKKLRDLYSAKTRAPGAGKAVRAVPRSAARPKTKTLAVARPQRAKTPPMSAMEEQLLLRYGLQPGIQRPGIVPLARNPETGSIELTAPQFVYDAARAFEAPGMVLAGNEVDLPEEAQNFAVNFTGGGLGAGRFAAPLEEGAVLGMAGAKKARPKPEPTRAYTPEELAVYKNFGSKQVAESKRQQQVASAGKQSSKVISGNRGKVSPTVYRDLQAKSGPEAVLAAGKKGEHLKRTETGYIGFPRTVNSPSDLGVMRRNLDMGVQTAADAIKLADPDNLGNWYNRARAGMAESTEPYQLPRVLEQHGVYSAGVSPESELGFALKHLNSRALGEPGMAFRSAGANTLDSAVAENRAAVLGDKTGVYMTKQDPRIPGSGLFGVNDFRWAQGMGYTDPQGMPWKAAVSSTMHPVMDMETGLMTQRANQRAMGGRTDWLGEQMQEIPWVYGKAQDLYSRGNSPTGRFGGEPIEGMTAALREANRTPADFYPKHTLSGTYETVPGASTGHMSDVLGMTPEQKKAYGAEGSWAQPSPESAAIEQGLIDMPPEVGAGLRDVLYGAAGFRQLPTIESSGAYKNMAGDWEYKPLSIARPLVDYPTGGGARIAPLTENAVNAIERFRAVADAQEAGAANLPNTLRSLPGKNAMLLDTGGTQPTSEQLRTLIEGLGPAADTHGVTATNRGAYIFPYNPDESPSSLKALNAKYMESLLPGSTATKAGGTGVYTPGIGKWGDEGIEPTTPYSGEATMGLLQEFANNPQELAMNLGESEAVRNALRDKYLRDLRLHNEMGSSYRGDIQETRRFLSEADWPKAVDLIRKGLSPAAAIAALGYSASAMAQDTE